MGSSTRDYPGDRRAGQQARKSRTESQYKAEANGHLREKLKSYKRRDVGDTKRVIDDVVRGLNERIQGKATAVYGGSVAKGTYVEGMSDHDVVVRVPGKDFESRGPQAALKYLAESVRSNPRFTDWSIKTGEMAVTMTDPSGREVQLVPAITQGRHGIRVKQPGKNEWSTTTQPKRFASRLSALNQRHNGKVTETIRLFKDMQPKQLPPDMQLGGYHVEAIAYMAFRKYRRHSWTNKDMLHAMTKAAAGIIHKPITDATGQNRHVDDSFGPVGSPKRSTVSQQLQKIANDMNEANKTHNATYWKDLS